MALAEVVLKLDTITLDAGWYDGASRFSARLELRSGELVLIDVTDVAQASALADACSGLVTPATGAIEFLGYDWSLLAADRANRLRARIGRLFSRGNWLEDVSVLENVILPALYHTTRTPAELRSQAARLARRFMLPGIPLGLPGEHDAQDLLRAGWIRALLGRPYLLLLEEPMAEFGPQSEYMAPLIDALRRARDRGAAVMWLTSDDPLWRDRSIPADRRYRMTSQGLVEAGRAAKTARR